VTLCLCGELQDSSDDALHQDWDIEVDQQADPFVGQLKVGQKLGLVNRQQFLNGFQFQDDFVLHDQIDLVTTIRFQTFVVDRQDHLPLKAHLPKAKLVAKAFFVSRFQETGAEVAMDLKRCPENKARPRVPRLVSRFVGLYVNRMETLAHTTISSQNYWGTGQN